MIFNFTIYVTHIIPYIMHLHKHKTSKFISINFQIWVALADWFWLRIQSPSHLKAESNTFLEQITTPYTSNPYQNQMTLTTTTSLSIMPFHTLLQPFTKGIKTSLTMKTRFFCRWVDRNSNPEPSPRKFVSKSSTTFNKWEDSNMTAFVIKKWTTIKSQINLMRFKYGNNKPYHLLKIHFMLSENSSIFLTFSVRECST